MPKEIKSTRRSSRRQRMKVDNNKLKAASPDERGSTKSATGNERHNPLRRESSKREHEESKPEKRNVTMTSTELLHSISGGIIESGIKYIMFPLHLLRFCIFGTNSTSEKLAICEADEESKDSESSGKKTNKEEKETKSSRSKEDRHAKNDEASNRRSSEESRKNTKEVRKGDDEGLFEKPPVVVVEEDSDSSGDKWSTASSTMFEDVSMDIDRSISVDSLVELMDISMEDTYERSQIAMESREQKQNSRVSVVDEIAMIFQKQCTSSDDEYSSSHILLSEKRERTGGKNFLCHGRTSHSAATDPPKSKKEEADKERKKRTSSEDVDKELKNRTSSEDVDKERKKRTSSEDVDKERKNRTSSADFDKERKKRTSSEDVDKERKNRTSSEDVHKERKNRTSSEDVDRERKKRASSEDVDRERKKRTSSEDVDKERKKKTSSEDVDKERKKKASSEDVDKERKKKTSSEDVDKERKKKASSEDVDKERKTKTSSEFVTHHKRRKVSQEEDKPEKKRDGQRDAKRHEEIQSPKRDTPSKSRTRSPRTPVKSKDSKRKDVKYKETATQTDSAFSDDDVEMIPVDAKLPEKRFCCKYAAYRSHPNLYLNWEARYDSNYGADNEDSSDGFARIVRKRVSSCSTSSSSTDLGFDEHGTPPDSDIGTSRWHAKPHDSIASYRMCSRAPPGFPRLPQNPPLLSCTHMDWYKVTTTSLKNNPCDATSAPPPVPRAPSPMRHLYYDYPEFMDLPATGNSSKILDILSKNYYR